MPTWAAESLEEAIKKYSSLTFSKENIESFRKELSEIGLEKYIPESIAQVLERKHSDEKD